VVVCSHVFTLGRYRDGVIIRGVFGKVVLSVGNMVLEDVKIVEDNRPMG
jgi:hypothetical protein